MKCVCSFVARYAAQRITKKNKTETQIINDCKKNKERLKTFSLFFCFSNDMTANNFIPFFTTTRTLHLLKTAVREKQKKVLQTCLICFQSFSCFIVFFFFVVLRTAYRATNEETHFIILSDVSQFSY